MSLLKFYAISSLSLCFAHVSVCFCFSCVPWADKLSAKRTKKYVVNRHVFRSQNGQKCVCSRTPLGELTVPPQTPSWTMGEGKGKGLYRWVIKEGGEGKEKKGREREGREEREGEEEEEGGFRNVAPVSTPGSASERVDRRVVPSTPILASCDL